MGTGRERAGLAVQAVAVVALLGAAAGSLWRAGDDALARERRRADAGRVLARVDDALAVRGAKGLSIVPSWPETLDPEDWDVLDLWLSAEAASAIAEIPGVEAGYFLPSVDRYVGSARSGPVGASPAKKSGRRRPSAPPSVEFDLIDDRVREALERNRPIDRLIDSPGGTLAVRASPVKVNGRRVAATWALLRLDDPGSFGRSLRSYQWSTGLALGGILVALGLSTSLTLTIRRQRADRERILVEMKRNERLAALGKLLAGVSHEIRNPLAGVRSLVQLWERGLVNDSELTSELLAEVDRLESIVARMLQFSKVGPRSLEPGDLNAQASEAARLAQPSAEAQGVGIVLDLAADLPPSRFDPQAILQILRNLTTNALQAMPRGGTMQIRTRRDPSRGGVEATVSDTGPGLAPEARDHLFEPFFTTRAEGTGLGLAIAREIALAHHGELLAGDAPKGGAAMTLFLPSATARPPLADLPSPSRATRDAHG